MRLAMLQLAPILRDPDANATRIAAAAREAAADLLLTPELSLTGYDLGDDAALLAAHVRPGEPAAFAPALADAPDVVVGLPELGGDGVIYNTAVHVRSGRVLHRHRKRYLPAWGAFDEMRWFGRGARVEPYDAGEGWRVCQLLCEDFWHPALSYLMAVRGVNLLLVAAAAPGRGVMRAEGDALFATTPVWERMARTTAQMYGMYIALANRVGVEGGVTFAGGSAIIGPDGEVLARAGEAEDALLTAELSLEQVGRNRRAFANVTDEDPNWMLDELKRALEGTP